MASRLISGIGSDAVAHVLTAKRLSYPFGYWNALGAWASGLIFDLSGSYRLAFLLSIASYLAGCVAFWFLRRPALSRA